VTAPRRIAVVGAGVAGLTTAWLLSPRHRVTLFEREPRLGGHTRTLRVPSGPDAGTPIDTGFIVMNHRNYPLFTRLLAELRVELDDSDMSFSYHDTATGFAWSGSGLQGLFATPSSLVAPAHWAMLRDILRFNRRATADLAAGRLAGRTLGEYVAAGGYGAAFARRYLFAMGAAIWSCPPGEAARFPAEAYLRFFHNHGLLALANRPQWRSVRGGSATYIERMRDRLGEARPACPVDSLRRTESGVELFSGGRMESFDAVVLACHADEALALLQDPSPEEARLLGAWRYSRNRVVLHTDARVMPSRRAAWASWNVAQEPGAEEAHPVSLSYHMNRLQRLGAQRDYFVTLNRRGALDEAAVIDHAVLTHPVYTADSLASQPALRALSGTRHTAYAGAYLGYGFHEDAVRSAVEVARVFGCPTWDG
jgi:predicted NAD/FAD-binding protein